MGSDTFLIVFFLSSFFTPFALVLVKICLYVFINGTHCDWLFFFLNTADG